MRKAFSILAGAKTAKRWRWCLFWLALALVVRGGAAWVAADALQTATATGIAIDGESHYAPMAENLLGGHGFCRVPGKPNVTHVPGYPLLLAATKLLVGSTRASVAVLQVITGALVVATIFLLGTMLFSQPTAHIAALIALVFPDLVIYSLLNMSDGPSLLLFLIGCCLLLGVLRTGRLALAAGLAIVLGLGVLVREGNFAFVGFWALLLLVVPTHLLLTRRLGIVAVFLALTVAILSPWWIRNWRVYHEFIPLTTKGALNIYSGTLIRPYYFTDHRNELVPIDADTLAREDAVKERARKATTFRERDRIWLEAAWENIKRDPSVQIVHLGRKLGFLWQPNIAPRHASRVGFAPILWSIAAVHHLLLFAGLIGFWFLRANREATVILTFSFFVITIFHVLVGIGEPRYHFLAWPSLILATAAMITTPIQSLLDRLRVT